MRVVTRLFSLVAASAIVASVAQAQTCLGFASLATAPRNITGMANFMDGANSFGAQFNWRAGTAGVLGISAGMTSVDGGENATDLGAMWALEKKTNKTEWCPAVGFNYSMMDGASVMGLSGVLGLGWELGTSDMKWVPNIWGGFGWAKADCDGCEGSTDGIFGGGLGLRFSNGTTLTPNIQMTTAEGSDPVFGVMLSIPLKKGS
jgi:hypothetical protein